MVGGVVGGMCGREHAWQGGHALWGMGGMHGRGSCMVRGCVAGEMAAAMDGKHPTGMLSCFL